MIPLSTLRARLARLEAQQPSPVRRFIVVAGEPDQVDRALLAALPGEVTLVTSGVCRDPLDTGSRQPVMWEQVGAAWVLTDAQALAA
jgi:hypothetical protein